MADLVRLKGEPIGRGLDVLYILLRVDNDGCGFEG